ncbi:bifunctional riboflavin kinase/FAD synthetase [Flavobacterium silvaticum]|uniref:Riboflavin biosynthesis protein n=1 Tax=Flavobacterium silvaticum TaxID=1852020 RepID=A0A972G0I7_9FLAO|nr:bifunctional riboflavin kinase/FAD synthetase [Flavobacterium silvaticum]NMH28206.1 bifunctional riboflavin kinase/FAD synthetase [Flavobacterium silvaticum]
MDLFPSISDYKKTGGTVVTLGTFDGVHIGHRKIISRLTAAAKEESAQSLVLTFFPHPRMVLKSGEGVKLLSTMYEKARLLADLGLQSLVVHPFDADFSQMSAEEFVSEVLVKSFGTKKIIVGHDHRFGKDRSANFDDLVRFGEQFGFKVEQIPAEQIDDISVSSTKIRNALAQGDIPLANSYLGYEYLIGGTVVHGKKLGRTIGFPTANISLNDSGKLIPSNGVYAVKSNIDGREVLGMMNIGNRPTVDGNNLSIEVNYFDFDADLYDREIEVFFVERLRDEQKFASIDALKEQLHADMSSAKKILSK